MSAYRSRCTCERYVVGSFLGTIRHCGDLLHCGVHPTMTSFPMVQNDVLGLFQQRSRSTPQCKVSVLTDIFFVCFTDISIICCPLGSGTVCHYGVMASCRCWQASSPESCLRALRNAPKIKSFGPLEAEKMKN